MASVIAAEHLTKVYRDSVAVEDLNLFINRGEIYGFLGLNGAGKTTTIRMLLGLVAPTAGRGFLNGRPVNPGNLALWREVGYIVETPTAYPELTVRENLQIMARLRGVGKQDVTWIMRKLALGSQAEKRAKHLSLGNAQRLGIAKALLHKPGILLLDEPTNGLDPAGIVAVRDLLRDLVEKSGVTILLSSHKLDEIARIATRIGIIHRGRLIKELAARELEDRLHKWLAVDGRDRGGMAAVLAESGHILTKGREGVLRIRDERAVKNPEKVAAVLVESGHPPTLLKVERENLEMFFLRSIKEAKGDLNGRVEGGHRG